MSDVDVAEVREHFRDRQARFRRRFAQIGDEATDGLLWGDHFERRWSQLACAYLKLAGLRRQLRTATGVGPTLPVN